MHTVNIHEAKTHLSRLLERAAAGEEIVIAKAGRPIARLVPLDTSAEPRTLGLLAGSVRESEGWWLPDDTLAALFEGDPMEPDESHQQPRPPHPSQPSRPPRPSPPHERYQPDSAE
jgi:prevent-host-death family protein